MSDKRYQGNIITDNPTDPTANSSSSYGTASGVWSLAEAKDFSAAGKWPVPVTVPAAPTIGTATGGEGDASVAFTANATGGFDITSFTATSNPGSITGTGSSSPITVSGLTNGTAYTFTVTATNPVGTSAASSASNSVTPAVNLTDVGFFYAGRVGTNAINKISIPSTGNATGYGNLGYSNAYTGIDIGGNATRGLIMWGELGFSVTNEVTLFEYASTGTNGDFGDLTVARRSAAVMSNSTRICFAQGYAGGQTNVIDYFTIGSTGNATDFGDSTESGNMGKGCGSSTRGVYNNGSATNKIDIAYITIASTGNANDFGDLTTDMNQNAAGSNSTRGLIAGGSNGGDSINYVTIASAGNASDFGDLSAGNNSSGAATTATRWVTALMNGYNTLEYVTIASTSNTTDFGDLTWSSSYGGASSTAHGGL